VYSKWDDAGNVLDYPGEQHACTGPDRSAMTPQYSAMTPQYRTDGDATKERSAKDDVLSGFGLCEESEEEGEYVDTIDCRSTDGSSDGAQEDSALEARFVEYYNREQGGGTNWRVITGRVEKVQMRPGRTTTRRMLVLSFQETGCGMENSGTTPMASRIIPA
jgi:hypothetical protein